MSGKSQFVTCVGKLPFPGRHQVRRDLREGLRAARRGDRIGRLVCVRSIEALARTNARHARYSLADVVIFSTLAAVHDSALYAMEAGAASVLGLGFGVSALAQRIVASRLREQPVAEEPILPRNEAEPLEASRMSLTEAAVVVTGALGGTALTLQGTITASYDLIRAALNVGM